MTKLMNYLLLALLSFILLVDASTRNGKNKKNKKNKNKNKNNNLNSKTNVNAKVTARGKESEVGKSCSSSSELGFAQTEPSQMFCTSHFELMKRYGPFDFSENRVKEYLKSNSVRPKKEKAEQCSEPSSNENVLSLDCNSADLENLGDCNEISAFKNILVNLDLKNNGDSKQLCAFEDLMSMSSNGSGTNHEHSSEIATVGKLLCLDSNSSDIENLEKYAKNSAVVRDFIMPLLKKSAKHPNWKERITANMKILQPFVGEFNLSHEFWKFQMDLFAEQKPKEPKKARHLFDEFERMFNDTEIEESSDNNPIVQMAMKSCAERTRKVYQEEKSTYETPEFIEMFERDFPQQDTIEEALDFCSQQLITMQSALQRHLELIHQFDEKDRWWKIVEQCTAVSSEYYVTNLWMRRLAEIRAEKNIMRRNLLLGKFALILEHKLEDSCPGLLTYEGVERRSDLWMNACVCITKTTVEFNSEIVPDLKIFFDDIIMMYSLAQLRILRSLWKHLSYPYDKENYTKVIFDYEGFEPVYRADALEEWLDRKTSFYLLENFAPLLEPETLERVARAGDSCKLLSSKLTVTSYQQLITNIMKVWPQYAKDELCSTLKDCLPLSNEEWEIFVTPMKNIELLPSESGMIDLSGPEILDVGHEMEGVNQHVTISETGNEETHSDCKQEINTSSTVPQPTAIPSQNETVEEETERLEKERQATIEEFNKLKKISGRMLVLKRKEARLLSSKVTCTTTAKPTVLLANLGDFLALVPEAARVHEMNKKDRTVVKALNRRSKKQRFRWALDPSVVIDFKTYKFLASVFVPALSSRKTLSFTEFEDCVKALGGTVSGNVYSFPRRLEVDGQIYITPHGEVHPEHKSSDVNHKSMSIFLEYAGFHVDLFERIN